MTKSCKKAAKKTSSQKATSKKQAPVTQPVETQPVVEVVEAKTLDAQAAAEAKASKKAKAPKQPKERKVRIDTKGAKILALIQREGGASVQELAKAAGWQNHSVRGFISGNLGKRPGLKVESIKREGGTRAYFLAAAAK